MANEKIDSAGFFERGLRAPALLLCACLFLFALRIGSFGLLEGGESYYPAAVREMLEAGDLVVPHLNYQIYFSKPIMTFWLIASAFKLFGVSELSGRLWSVLFSIGLVFICYATTRLLINGRAAFLAGLILASSPLLIGTCRRSSVDIFFSFFLDASICATMLLLFAGRKRYWSLVYISLALAVLTKGPVALVLFSLAALLFLLVRRPERAKLCQWLSACRILPGTAIFLGLVLPWFVAIGLATRGLFLKVFFLYENLSRFAGHTNSKTPHFWWYLWTLLYGLFPFSLFLPQSLIRVLALRRNESSPEIQQLKESGATTCDALLFAASSAVAMLVFFSLSRTQFETYVLPAWCPLVIVLAWHLERTILECEADYGQQRISAALNSAAAEPIFSGGGKKQHAMGRLPSLAIALAAVAAAPPVAIVVALAPQLGLDLAGWMPFAVALSLSGMAAGWIGQYFLFRNGKFWHGILVLSGGTAIAYGAMAPVLTELWYQRSFAQVESMAASLSRSDAEVAQYNDFMPALLYYRKGPVDFFYHAEDLVPKSAARQDELKQAAGSLFIIVRSAFAKDLTSRPELDLQLVEQRGDWRLYRSDSTILRRAPTLQFTFERLTVMDVLTDKYHWGPLTMPYSGGDFKRPPSAGE